MVTLQTPGCLRQGAGLQVPRMDTGKILRETRAEGSQASSTRESPGRLFSMCSPKSHPHPPLAGRVLNHLSRRLQRLYRY